MDKPNRQCLVLALALVVLIHCAFVCYLHILNPFLNTVPKSISETSRNKGPLFKVAYN